MDLSGLLEPQVQLPPWQLTAPAQSGSVLAPDLGHPEQQAPHGVCKQGSSPSNHLHQQLEAPLLATLARLQRLDVSNSWGLGPHQLSLLLSTCTSLTDLDCRGCKGLAASCPAVVSSLEGSRQKHGKHGHESKEQARQQGEEGHEEQNQVRGQQERGPPQPPEQAQAQEGLAPCLPNLRRLSVGWGFRAPLLRQLCTGAPTLTCLELGIGAAVGDGLLEAVAKSCRHLQQLRLVRADVSDAGAAQTAC